MHTVIVKTPGKSYSILIQSEIASHIKELLISQKIYESSEKIFIITDHNVASHHLAQIEEQLPITKTIILPPGESTKTIYWYENICEILIDYKVQRDSLIIALGGGVVGDIAGFVASTILRGIKIVQIPTSLLAQIDSSVGGKTAINSPKGKNLIGTFYHPALVIIDPKYLDTLPNREFLSGYAEMVKYGLINDRHFFLWLQKNGPEILKKNKNLLEKAIDECCKNKANIVNNDANETKQARMLLNLGHTFGHIIETELKYDGTILHGEAVAIGICQACDLSVKLGYLSEDSAKNVISYFDQIGLPTKYPEVLRKNRDNLTLVEDLYAHLERDKKNTTKGLAFIILKDIGKAISQTEINAQIIKDIIHMYINNMDEK